MCKKINFSSFFGLSCIFSETPKKNVWIIPLNGP